MNKTFAYLIIAAVLVSAFIGVFTFELIDTDPAIGPAMHPYGSGPLFWGETKGALSLRFELTEDVEITSVMTSHSFRIVAGSGTYRMTGRITADVNDVLAPSVAGLNFRTFEIPFESGKAFSYEAITSVPAELTKGWYRYVMLFYLGGEGGDLNDIFWHYGSADSGTAGEVEPGEVYADNNRDGDWEGQSKPIPSSFTVSLYGSILEGEEPNGDNGDNETANGDNETANGNGVIDTNGNDEEDDRDIDIFGLAIGFIFLILGVIFLYAGRSSVALIAIGLGLFILGLIILAGVSFLALAMVALAFQKDRVQLINPRTGRWVKLNTKKGGIVHHKLSPGPFKNVRKHKHLRVSDKGKVKVKGKGPCGDPDFAKTVQKMKENIEADYDRKIVVDGEQGDK